MQLALRRKLRRLPKSFPIGTTYVVEGHVVEGQGDEGGGQLQVFSRYVVLPSGQRINLGPNIGNNLGGEAVPRRGGSGSRTQGTARGRAKRRLAGAKKMMADGGTSARDHR
jgi:hypothetical protein